MANNWKYWDDAGEHEWVAEDPLPTGADLFKVEFLQQFVDASNERGTGLGTYEPISSPAQGDDPNLPVAGTTWLRNLQARIADQSADFIDTDQLGSFGEKAWGDNIPVWTAATVAAHTSDRWKLSSSLLCPRQSTDGTTFGNGRIGPADILGPWLFEDMRELLTLLSYVEESFAEAIMASGIDYLVDGYDDSAGGSTTAPNLHRGVTPVTNLSNPWSGAWTDMIWGVDLPTSGDSAGLSRFQLLHRTDVGGAGDVQYSTTVTTSENGPQFAGYAIYSMDYSTFDSCTGGGSSLSWASTQHKNARGCAARIRVWSYIVPAFYYQ